MGQLVLLLSLLTALARAQSQGQQLGTTCGMMFSGVTNGQTGFWDCISDGSRITGAVIAVTSTSLASVPLSVGYVGIATTTAVLRGSRPVLYEWVTSFTNNANQLRQYDCQMAENGVFLTASHRATQISATRNLGTMSGHTLLPSSTAGTMNLSLRCKTDNATGAQTADTPHLTIVEF